MLLACEAWALLGAVEPAVVCATQPGTSARGENPKDAVFVLIPPEYVGKPRGLERFVCVKPTAAYAIAMIRCSQPAKSVR